MDAPYVYVVSISWGAINFAAIQQVLTNPVFRQQLVALFAYCHGTLLSLRPGSIKAYVKGSEKFLLRVQETQTREWIAGLIRDCLSMKLTPNIVIKVEPFTQTADEVINVLFFGRVGSGKKKAQFLL